ncbi:MAG: hypothetical protein R3322_12230 [Kiloniellales bacterium]|jgi:hypothetical protein|nr:hypothetical protein [Kiloniellales bacterium]
MAKKPKAKSSGKRKETATASGFDAKELTKGELRKLNALRKSVGEKLGEETFSKWLKKQSTGNDSVAEDKNAAMIADALLKLVDEKSLRIPRGGYLVTRGRGRVIVTKAKDE